MKTTFKRCFIIILFISMMTQHTFAQNVFIPDANFRTYLQTNYSTCMSGNDLITTCGSVTSATSMNVNMLNISDLTGLEYFTGLTSLYCQSNQLSVLPALPLNLTILSCGSNQLSVLPALPANLSTIDCSFNQLSTLPPLPVNFNFLSCSHNQFTTLPSFTGVLLKNLDCSFNQLTSLPTLPANLGHLLCASNQLTRIPYLPSTLTELSCENNLLTQIPVLPETMQTLSCDDNQITSIPDLPANFLILNCRNNLLTSLPTLPNSLFKLYVSGNEINCLPNVPAGLIRTDIADPIVCTALSNVADDQVAAIVAYPNPFNQSIQVKLADTYNGIFNISVYDVSGRVCETKVGVNAEEVVEMGTLLGAGMYLIEVQGADRTERIQVVKQ